METESPLNTETILPAVLSLLFVATNSLSGMAAEVFPFHQHDVVVLVGGTNMVNLQRVAYLETQLTLANAHLAPRFRDLAWDADTVFAQGTVMERWRVDKYGEWPEQLKINATTVIVAQFGQMEAIDGPQNLPAFIAAYEELVKHFQQQTSRIVLLSPTPFERHDPLQPDLSLRNDDLAAYVEAIDQLATRNKCLFVDLFHPLITERPDRITTNGIHLNDVGQQLVANLVSRNLGLKQVETKDIEQLRPLVRRKHQLWFNYWRPANWKCLWGDDGERNFGKATDGGESLRDEWATLMPMVEAAEAEIQAIATKELRP